MLAAYMSAISAVSLILVQVIKTSVINRFALDDASRIAWVQLTNYGLNFIMLIALLNVAHLYDASQIFFYILAPIGSAGASSTVFTLITTMQRASQKTPTPTTTTPTAPTAPVETPV